MIKNKHVSMRVLLSCIVGVIVFQNFSLANNEVDEERLLLNIGVLELDDSKIRRVILESPEITNDQILEGQIPISFSEALKLGKSSINEILRVANSKEKQLNFRLEGLASATLKPVGPRFAWVFRFAYRYGGTDTGVGESEEMINIHVLMDGKSFPFLVTEK